MILHGSPRSRPSPGLISWPLSLASCGILGPDYVGTNDSICYTDTQKHNCTGRACAPLFFNQTIGFLIDTDTCCIWLDDDHVNKQTVCANPHPFLLLACLLPCSVGPCHPCQQCTQRESPPCAHLLGHRASNEPPWGVN